MKATLLVTSWVTFSVAQLINKADYPPPLQVPPGNPEWTRAFLSNPMSESSAIIEKCINQADWAPTIDDGPSNSTTLALADLNRSSSKVV
jgi:hypothetical protein